MLLRKTLTIISLFFILTIHAIASTYTPISTIAPRSRAQSTTINDLNANTGAAFALLPDETDLSRGTVTSALDTGVADAYLVSLPAAPSGYVDNLMVVMIPLNTNTGASTINVDSLGVVAIKHQDGTSALDAGDIVAGVPIEMRYSSVTGFFHIGQNGSASVTAAAASAAAALISENAAAASAVLANNVVGDNFYPVYSATDQGDDTVDGGNNTINYYIDTIGSDQGTIVLRHNSGNATTPYTLTTSETIPANITLKVERGAIIDISTGIVLTMNSRPIAGDYKIFECADVTGNVVGMQSVLASWFGVSPDATALVNAAALGKAIQAAKDGEVNFVAETYSLGTVPDIDVPVTLNFNNSTINADTAGIVLHINLVLYVSQTVIIKDLNFLKKVGTTDPANFIKISHENNMILENIRGYGLTATHSLIYSYTSVATHLRNVVFETCTAPYAFYFNHDSSGSTIYTTAIDLDHIRLGAITGVGIYNKAIDFVMRGKSVVEICSGGGILFPDPATRISITDSYFETNTGFDIHFSNDNPVEPTNADVKGNIFLGSVPTKIKVDAGLILTASGNTYREGGVNGDAAPLSYVGINNTQTTATAGYTAGPLVEIADAIRGANNRYTIINKNGVFGSTQAGRHPTFPSIHSFGGLGTNTLPAGNRTEITMDGNSALVMVDIDQADADYKSSALFYITYVSATITVISDIESAWAITDAGALYRIYKSANSNTFTIKNLFENAINNTAEVTVTVNMLGAATTVAYP